MVSLLFYVIVDTEWMKKWKLPTSVSNYMMQSDQESQPNQHVKNLRKLSIPTAKLPGGSPTQPNSTKRRFSHVGLAVTRRLSIAPIKQGPSPEVMIVGRALAGLYLRSRLKRAGLYSRKPGLGTGAASVASIVKDVFPSLMCAANELERMHPKVFSNVVRQVGARYSGEKEKDDIDEAAIFLAISHQVLNADTWGAVVAIFCVAGALSIESARQGYLETTDNILDAVSEFLEERLAIWVSQHGGWLALTRRCRLQRTQSRLSMPLSLSKDSLMPAILLFVPICFALVISLLFGGIYF